MFKRFVLFSLGLFSLLGMFVFGQNVSEQNSGKVVEIGPMQFGDHYINYVRGYILNEKDSSWGRNLSFALNPGKEKKIQVKFKNTYPKDLVLFVEFHDGEKPTGALDPNAKACKPLVKSVDFPKYAQFSDAEKIIVPANGEVEKELIVKFPALTANGLKQGCMVYGVASTDITSTGGFFSVEFVKENYIDVLVMSGSASDIDTNIEFMELEKDTKINDLSSSKVIKAFFDQSKEFIIEAKLKNIGSLDEIANISGTISNIFGYKETFEWNNVKIPLNSNQGVLLSTKGSKTFSLPSYKGAYKIELVVNYKPTFDFDITNSNIDKKVLEGGTLTEKANIFLMPWMALVILVVFLILAKMAFRKRTVVVENK